jgi:tetratricopeptide (TPR) repeat protein
MRRRLFRPGLAASALLALTLTFGCAWQGHLKKGDEFMAAANYDAAATEYAQALSLHPNDEKIVAKLAQAQLGQVESRAQRARAALGAGADSEAIALTAEAYAILPDHPKTTALINEIVEVTGQRATTLAEAGKFAEAMQIYDGIRNGLPSAHDRVSAAAQAVSQAWVAQLTEAATAAEAAGRMSSALLYRAKIAALSGAGVAEREAARAQVSALLRYLVVTKVKPNDAGANTVASLLSGRQGASLLEVANAGERPAATLTIEFSKPKFSTDKRQREESVQYQSGTQQVENPFYKMAQDDVLDEERRLMERENDVTQQEQYVDQYSADVAREGDTTGTTTGAEQNLSNAQSRLEANRRSLEDQRNTLMRAKEKAASTEQFKQEPVYSNHSFTITTQVLTATVQAKAKLEHTDGRPALSLDQPLSAMAEDDTHAAQSVAGVAEDPLSLPGKDELAGGLYAQSAPTVGQLVADSFAGYRQGLLEQAGAATDPGEQLELLLRYVIVDPQYADAKIVADVFALSGVPDAAALLLAQ